MKTSEEKRTVVQNTANIVQEKGNRTTIKAMNKGNSLGHVKKIHVIDRGEKQKKEDRWLELLGNGMLED